MNVQQLLNDKSKKVNKIVVILVFLLIYFNNETLSNNICTFVEQPVKYVAILIFAYTFIQSVLFNKAKSKISIIGFVSLLISLVIISLLLDNGYTNAYVLLIINICVAMCMHMLIKYEDFSYLFIRIFEFLAIASLVCTYILKPIILKLPIFPTVENSANLVFSNAFVCYVVKADDYYRNTGIFREAGVFAAFLCIALMMLLNDKKISGKRKMCMIVIFVFTIITTFSSACYLVMAMIIFIDVIRNKKDNKNAKYIVLAGGICVLILSFFSLSGEYFFDAIDKWSSDSSSYQYRLEPILNGIRLAIDKPFGYGIQNGITALENINKFKDFHNTSTIITVQLSFGIVFFIAYVVGFIKLSKYCFGSVIYILPILLILNAEQYIYNPLFYLLIVYGINKSSVSDDILNEKAGII